MSVCVCVCLCIIEGTEGGVGGSVSQVHAGAKQGHQLFLIVSNVPLHDLLTGAQEALKCLHIYYCRKREERDVRTSLCTVDSSELLSHLPQQIKQLSHVR